MNDYLHQIEMYCLEHSKLFLMSVRLQLSPSMEAGAKIIMRSRSPDADQLNNAKLVN
jgi:hypothetical protein